MNTVLSHRGNSNNHQHRVYSIHAAAPPCTITPPPRPCTHLLAQNPQAHPQVEHQAHASVKPPPPRRRRRPTPTAALRAARRPPPRLPPRPSAPRPAPPPLAPPATPRRTFSPLRASSHAGPVCGRGRAPRRAREERPKRRVLQSLHERPRVPLPLHDPAPARPASHAAVRGGRARHSRRAGATSNK